MSKKNDDKNRYQASLNLPKTEFSIRANAQIKEPEIIEKWKSEDLYEKTYTKNEGKEKFVLHDGPPYANGPIHMGTALNKVLKDIVCKSKRMAGFHVPFKPGWDCHGLPIELKVATELKVDRNNPGFDKKSFKKACREFANKWIDVQQKEFTQIGVVAAWDRKYKTMSPEYEGSILKAFTKFIKDGYIERKGKTVPWCAYCQTVLAAAEIEYKDRKDPSIYVLFSLDKQNSEKLFADQLAKNPNLQINLLIWTTTPWTIPLNRAVVLHPTAKYVLLQGQDENTSFVVAQELADKVCDILKIEKKVLATFDSNLFEGYKINHPLVEGLKVPVLFDNSVLLNEGTACVHTAPGCGPEDYILGIKNNLEIYSPLSTSGKYTDEIKPEELKDMSVFVGLIWVLKKLHELGRLQHKTSIVHSYPHCWRCRNGLIFRATDQWFCNLEKNNLVEKSIQEAEKIKFIPDWGMSRFEAFISSRTEWCISRQREWGVPIPGIICKKCEKAYLHHEMVEKVANKVAQVGIEYWDDATLQKLIDENILDKNFKCNSCGNNDLNSFELERDILDVWFDSGVSHYAVLKNDKMLGFPCDLYLEGSDQHRGWFQSSLFASMILNEQAQAKQILTHGFVVDEKGHKMSKSIGNVIYPQDVMNKLSRDILRFWVSSSDYEGDIIISDQVLKNVTEVYRKVRNTCRFMVSNLYDFDIEKDAIEFDKMIKVDQFALAKLFQVNKKIRQDYQGYNFASVFHTLNNYCANDLSAGYLDLAKDRLYVEKADGLLRRSAQTVIYNILDTLTKLMAPILSFLAEEVSDFYQKDKKETIHLQQFATCPDVWGKSNIQTLGGLEEIKDVVLKSIEQQREAGVVKHSLEAKVTIYFDSKIEKLSIVQKFIKDLEQKEDVTRFFKDWFIVSQVEFTDSSDGLQQTSLPGVFVKAEHADGVKCPRCWQWSSQAGDDDLCPRCIDVLK